jgi:CTP-dependent riboflavin kinase
VSRCSEEKCNLDIGKVYRGYVRTGRGAAEADMSAPGSYDGLQRLTGLSVIPGTLNIALTEPFDLSLLNYVTFAELGWAIDLSEHGIEYDGEIGAYYGPVTVADTYPACVVFFTWAGNIHTDAELISPHHLRNTLNLIDGDMVEFRLIESHI